VQIYTVGGAVRDALLGLPVKDHDYVVVGATAEEMVARGFRPVGKDFPVFLHPTTQEEYALARTERKTAPGYKGFVIHADQHVTLEEDLLRRDLTVNAIAKAQDGRLIDPFDGCGDIQRRLFRHVSAAFSEDPVRILRIARFAARFTEFDVAPETLQLMQHMVADGEVDALVAERVLQEISRGLLEAAPSRMVDVLSHCAALTRIIPELAAVWSADTGDQWHAMLDDAQSPARLDIRYAVLMTVCCAGYPAQDVRVNLVKKAGERLKVPKECQDLAVMMARELGDVYRADSLDAEDITALLMRCDGLRKPERFSDMLQAMTVVFTHHDALHKTIAAQCALLLAALQAVQSVDAGVIATQHQHNPRGIADAVQAARLAAVTHYMAHRHAGSHV
jgi:tRNA nucleotidyltransferase (CCA-adding enzyme)